MDKPINIDCIPRDAMIDITVSGAFYERMQNCMLLMTQKQDPEHLLSILKELETREPANLWEEQLTILLALVAKLDEEAVKQNLIVQEPISTPSSGEASP